jgi:hypothetical protein
MSERPDADTTINEGAGANTYTPPPEPPRTVSKPGPGSTGPGTDDPEGDPPPKPKSGWSGSDKYPDGYRMIRQDDGQIFLETPSGEVGVWDVANRVWTDGGGNPKPEGWSGGHGPMTQTLETGQSATTPESNP